ncbi:MAG: DUF86 domain-containing protein [Candidatus Rokubacteria bacterium]|nr:DUF86 domain-containing protein [Candidatus Rokubacteria bacterium]
MVDRPLLAKQVATVRDAVARIRAVLPPSREAFEADRTTREVVVLNVFVAIQACIDLAAHWLADEGWDVPQRYGEIFLALADHGVIQRPLALRLVAAAGLRNLVAHQYGTLEWARLYATVSSSELDHLEAFCAALASKVR